MTTKSRQKFKYFKNEKDHYGEIKSIFHHFWKDFIEANSTIFLEGESLTFCLAKCLFEGTLDEKGKT